MVQHALDQATSSSSLKGFWMKSIAPFFMVFTAMGTSPWPVMNTMGRGDLRIRSGGFAVPGRSCPHADVDDQAGDFAGS